MRKSTTVRRTPLSPSAGPLRQTSDCCNISTLTLAADNSGKRVRVKGEGIYCFGGDNHAALDAVYRVEKNSLVCEENAEVAGASGLVLPPSR